MHQPIRVSDRMDTRRAQIARTALRLVLYGVLGVAFEVASFPVVRTGRTIPVLKYLFAYHVGTDHRLHLDGPWQSPLVTLFGQTSLWMIPIYALAALCIEVLYRRLLGAAWLLRGLVYGIVILVLELVTGLVLQGVTGYAIWTYSDAGNILETTSIYILPVWIVVGLGVELLYRELMDPEIRTALEGKLAGAAARESPHGAR